jgi:hypothetical protein
MSRNVNDGGHHILEKMLTIYKKLMTSDIFACGVKHIIVSKILIWFEHWKK